MVFGEQFLISLDVDECWIAGSGGPRRLRRGQGSPHGQ